MSVSDLKLKLKPIKPHHAAHFHTTNANGMGVSAAFQLIK